MSCYDEFGLLRENADEFGLPWRGAPRVRRADVETSPGFRTSALVWGEQPPEVALIHGGAQNAHTWDTVALALERPLVAIDLPGHGHSDHGEGADLDPRRIAREVAGALEALAPAPLPVIGMSLGGLTAIALTADRPDLVSALGLIDVTPSVDRERGAEVAAFVAGPEAFPSFEAILERTIAHNPGRSEASLRRGVVHNAVQREDGQWVWRHQLSAKGPARGMPDTEGLWEALSEAPVPVHLVRGSRSPVVRDEDVEALRRFRPDAAVTVVEGAGHSVQGDRPVELARVIADFLSSAG